MSKCIKALRGGCKQGLQLAESTSFQGLLADVRTLTQLCCEALFLFVQGINISPCLPAHSRHVPKGC